MSDYPSFRAPRADGSWMCVPRGDGIIEAALHNQAFFREARIEWLGISLEAVRDEIRRELPPLVAEHEAWYSESEALSSSDALNASQSYSAKGLLFLSGHQPELFHPGVWFKNFLLDQLAKRHFADSINIVVDHDLSRKTSLSVPVASDTGLRREIVPLCNSFDGLAWESTIASDVQTFIDSTERIRSLLATVGIENSSIFEIASTIKTGMKQSIALGRLLAAARHKLERNSGLENREIRFSSLCGTRIWAVFVGEFLSRFEEVHAVYNRCVEDYRQAHRIRNQAHPVPNLNRANGWWETPFWIYSTLDRIRRPLWIRVDGSSISMGDGKPKEFLTFSFDQKPQTWASILVELSEKGIAVRPRALTTTMFLRLAVADLFIHGIGGAKYDQVTDQIIHALWNTISPKYLVATATVCLPINYPVPGSMTEEEIRRRSRDWLFAPERAIGPPAPWQTSDELLETKRTLLRTVPALPSKPAWHGRLTQINERIRSEVPHFEAWLRDESRRAKIATQVAKIRSDREYSMALFPKAFLEARLKEMAERAVDA